MQDYHYETDRASAASVGAPSTPKSFLPRRVPKRGQTDEISSTWRDIPQSATAGQLSDPVTYRRAGRSSATWTSTSGDVGGYSDADELQDRGDFVREYNRIAAKHGLRLLSPDDDGPSSRETSPRPHRKGWFSRTFRRHPSSASNTSSAKSGRSDRKASHRRSISDLALQLVHPAKRDILKDEDLQSLVRLCGKSMFYLPSEYAASSLILPTCLRATAQYLVQHATETRGVFRIPGSVRVVNALYDYYCTEGDPDEISSTTRCPSLPVHVKAGVHDVASAFKRLLSGLPGGILGSLPLFDAMVSIHSQLNGDPEATRTKQTKLRARMVALAIGSLRSQLRRELICAVFGLLCLIGRVAETAPREDEFGRPLPTADLMGYNALGIVFGPLLVGDLLNSYSMRSSSVHFLLPPVSPPPNCKWEKMRYKAPEEAIAHRFPNMDKVHVANSVAEMLITHWQEVVKQIRSLDVLRVVGSGTTDHCTLRRASLRSSVSAPFVLRKPPECQQNFPQTCPFPVSESPIPSSPTPETRGRGPSGGLRANRPRPALMIPRQRPRSSRSLSRGRLNTPGSVVLLSPTEEEPSGGDASLSNRQAKGSITCADEASARQHREGQQFGSDYVKRRQKGSLNKMRIVNPDSETPRRIRRRDGLTKSFTKGRDVHPLVGFHNTNGNKSQENASGSVFDTPLTNIPPPKDRGSVPEDLESTLRPSVRASSQDKMSKSSCQRDADIMLPDGKANVKSTGHRRSRFPVWKRRERSDKSTNAVDSAAKPPSPITASSERSSRQKGRRRLSFYLGKSTTTASAEEMAEQPVVDFPQGPTEHAAGAEETPEPDLNTGHYAGGPLSHFVTLSRATGRIARADRNQEAPSKPTTAHDQSHAKSRARSLASKIPRARKSDRRQTRRSSRESVHRSIVPRKSSSEHTLASVPPEVQHAEDRIKSHHEKHEPESRPSTVLKHDCMTDYTPPDMSFDGDLRPPTTPAGPLPYSNKSFTGSAVRAMAVMFETAAAKDKGLERPEIPPMPLRATGNVISLYTSNPPSPRKPQSSSFGSPAQRIGGMWEDGHREQPEYRKGSPNKSSGRGSHDEVDDEDEIPMSSGAAVGRNSKRLDEWMNEQQSHKSSRNSEENADENSAVMHERDLRLSRSTADNGDNRSKILSCNKAQYVQSPRSPHIPRPSSAPTGAPHTSQSSRVPMNVSIPAHFLQSAISQGSELVTQPTPAMGMAIASDILNFQTQTRRLQRQLDIKTEENDHLRSKLASFGAGRCSLPTEVSVRRSTSIKLSEHLRQTERECKAWRERAEAAEMRVAILERLLRSKMDGEPFKEEKIIDSEAKLPPTPQHMFVAEVYRSSVRDRLRRLYGVLDGCSESGPHEELEGEGDEKEAEDKRECAQRCVNIPIWSDREEEDHRASSDEPERGGGNRCVSQEKKADFHQRTLVGEDDSDDAKRGLDASVGYVSRLHPQETDETVEDQSSAIVGSDEHHHYKRGAEEDADELDETRTALTKRLARCTNNNVLGWKTCHYCEEEAAEDEAKEEGMALMGKWMADDDENEEEEKDVHECDKDRLVEMMEHAEMRIE